MYNIVQAKHLWSLSGAISKPRAEVVTSVEGYSFVHT
jgi:hypothetical protein